jgi:Ca-activated chloride channel family protein
VSLHRPLLLLLLLVPAALIGAYVVVQRMRRRYAVRFSSVELIASIAPKRPGWQRHVPAALVIAALVLMTVSFTRPSRVSRIPRNRATIVLVIDVSASMAANDVRPNRLVAAQEQAARFVKGVPASLQIGLVSFDRTAHVLVAPSTERATVLDALNRLQTGPGTNTADAIDLAVNAAKTVAATATGTPAPAVIVLMSDGVPTIGRPGEDPIQAVDDASANARAADIPIDTIAFGTANGVVGVNGRFTRVAADPETMARIADATGGQSFSATSASQLKSVYDQIGKAVGYDKVDRDISVWFTAFGLVALVLAAGAALVWTDRLL